MKQLSVKRPTAPNVACNAQRGRGVNRKQSKRLEVRLEDYSRMMADRNSSASKVQSRKDNGGFHRPGSNQ